MPDQKPTTPQQFSGVAGLILAILGFAAAAYAVIAPDGDYHIAMPLCHLVGAVSGFYGSHTWAGKVGIVLCGLGLSLVIALFIIIFALSFVARMPVC